MAAKEQLQQGLSVCGEMGQDAKAGSGGGVQDSPDLPHTARRSHLARPR